MIEVTGLIKTYAGNVRALCGVDMRIEGRGMFGLLGPNGAGKTTLMRILAGILHPTAGRVSVFGHDLSTPSGRQAAKALLGYLPQELGLHPDLTAYEFLDYIAILKGMTDSGQRRRQIDELLEMVRLSEDAGRRLKTYSGGMKRRVGIAQALLGDPRLVIVDEPTVGLDPEERVRLRNLLGQVARRCAVILSTHIVEDIGQSCGDLAVIARGNVLRQCAPRDLAEVARGHVWEIAGDDDWQDDELTVVSTRHDATCTRYRVVGDPGERHPAAPLAPTLEDGYLWLMRD